MPFKKKHYVMKTGYLINLQENQNLNHHQPNDVGARIGFGASSSRHPSSLPETAGFIFSPHSYQSNHVGISFRRPISDRSILDNQMQNDFRRFEAIGFTVADTEVDRRFTASTRTLQKLLIWYINLKIGRTQFVNHLHSRLCVIIVCDCKRYGELISHFERCANTYCHLCGPVRMFFRRKAIRSGTNFASFPIKRFPSESEQPNGYVSGFMPAASKRVKTDNAVIWPAPTCNAVADNYGGPMACRKFNGVSDYMQDPYGFNEASSAVNWNISLNATGKSDELSYFGGDYMKSVCTNEVLVNNKNCKEKTNRVTQRALPDNCSTEYKKFGFSSLGPSPINSVSSNEVPISESNLGNSLKTVSDDFDLTDIISGINGASPHAEKQNSWNSLQTVCEARDHCYVNLGTDDAVPHAEEHNSGNSLQTVWDAFDHCGINFGTVDAIPHAEENNSGNSFQTISDVLDLCGVNLGTDEAIPRAEEHNSVDENCDMDWVKTSNVKIVATLCTPISSSDSICVLPQQDHLGKSNGVLDIDNINLGKDYAIPSSQEQNLVLEQQEIGLLESNKVETDNFSVHPRESPVDGEENLKLTSRAEQDSADARYDLDSINKICLTDFFTTEQIKEHLRSFNQDINSEARATDVCQLCSLDTITFTALDLRCSSCGARIEHKSTYYWTLDRVGMRQSFCTKCLKNARGRNISFKGMSFPKSELQKGTNTAESDEAWVRCDKCQGWQHEICALYNKKLDFLGDAKYTCPFCRLKDIEEAKDHVSITPPSGAEDLPRTKLSDHIEQRLFKSLRQERKLRAERLGKKANEVPGASDLKVRVVLDVNKQLKVKQQFLDVLQNETYPTEFPYKSKVILLFQKVDGVDVCIFAMYVQEFGSECGKPNNRSVYISYLDSVKYFRPDTKTVAGILLRTFVYHEILVGYLDYCKKLGFVTCYLWSCPPSKGEDYILHCHPKTQKRPNQNKLVQWYKKMLKKAKEENVVVGISNFHDHFFVPNGEKITAARLPYFDGDYWSCTIEDIAQSFDMKTSIQMTKRTMKAMGHNHLPTEATKDLLVMQKLEQRIIPLKDQFFVIDLQFTCSKCRETILSGSCWSCEQCSKFRLCSRCHKLELSSNIRSTHTTIYGDKHQLYKTPVKEVAADTDDKEGPVENDIFKDRHSFLNLCEKNYYRFDTLRRAKYSSMMILHHLHASNKGEQAQEKEVMQQLENVLEHANQCSSTIHSPCLQFYCNKIRTMFGHSNECEIRAAGGCRQCKIIWTLLRKHAQNCKASNCSIPRCMDLKNYNKTVNGKN